MTQDAPAEAPYRRRLASGTVVEIRWDRAGVHDALVVVFPCPAQVEDLQEVFAHLETLGVPGVVVADHGSTEDRFALLSSAPLRHTHALVVREPGPLLAAAAAEAGALFIPLGSGLATVVRADDGTEATRAALVLLSYLPVETGGAAPVYAAHAPAAAGAVAGPGDWNAQETLFGVADDAMTLWTGDTDELLIGLARVGGRTVVCVVPQPIVSEALGPAAAAALSAAIALAVRYALPLAVFAPIPPLAAGARPLAEGLLAGVAAAARRLRRCILFAHDDVSASPCQAVLASAPSSVLVADAGDMRAQLLRWIASP